MKIVFSSFRDKMKEFYGYSDIQIKHLFNAIKNMDNETRLWVIKWFNNDVFPDKEIEGITVETLIDKHGYKPMNAFIIIDWLKNDPKAAKYFVLKRHEDLEISNETGKKMEEFLIKNGKKSVGYADDVALEDIEENE